MIHVVEKAGDRLDHYLAAHELCTSRSEAQRLIEDGHVLVNQQKQKPAYAVAVRDQISVNKPSLKPTDLIPKKIDFEILFEDDDLLVVNKPAGLSVHPGAGNYDESLVHGLLYHGTGLSGIGGVERPGIVHRLDKGTTGVMVIAKNDRAHQNLSAQFQNKLVKKEYVALCLGKIEKDEQRLIHLMKRAEMNRKRFVVNQKKGKEAITNVTVIQKNTRVSYVLVKPETGRTHQIRVHLSYIGHPIMGDELYGGTKKLHAFDEDEKKYIRELGRPLLHARKISFVHPRTKERVEFEVGIPKDFQKSLEFFL